MAVSNSTAAGTPHDRATAVGTVSRRDGILRIAAEQFAKQGFHGVSMRDIAKASGCSPGTLYNYFAGKDDLLLAIGERLFSGILEHLESVTAQPSSGLLRLERMLRVAVAHCLAYRNEFLNLTHDKRHIRTTPALAPLIASRDACLRLWRQVLTDGVADGSIRSDLDTEATIWMLLSVITGIVDEHRAAQFAGTDVGAASTSLIATLIDGLRAHS